MQPKHPLDDEAALALIQWLIERGTGGASETDLLAHLCERLVAAGIPLLRVVVAADLLHPTLDAQGFRWQRGGTIATEQYYRLGQREIEEQWLHSPFAYMLDRSVKSLRRRLDQGYELGEFPILDRLKAEGATDYLAFMVPVGDTLRLGDTAGLAGSWTIDRPGGYYPEELAFLDRIVPALALAFHALAMAETARTLLRTYLGVDAADRVLKGNIVRGRAETIQAVIWYSDLAGFTRIADTTEQESVLELLNEYAERLVDIIEAQGGHVLKFIGDGILAIFPGEDREKACADALDAVLAAEAAVAALNEGRRGRGATTTDFYVCLHAGDVLYGNFGGRSRLDFTVLGPAVNEASRMSALCRSLEQRVVTSAGFAEAAGERRSQLVSLGRYALRGVARPQELFTIDRTAPAPGPSILHTGEQPSRPSG